MLQALDRGRLAHPREETPLSNFSYQSSFVFEMMKKSQEEIPVNMTSFQYLSIYDEFLYKAVAPIVEETNFARVFVANLLGWQEKNFRRKISFKPRREATLRGLEFIVASPQDQLRKFRRIYLERGVLAELVTAFITATEEASRASSLSVEMRQEGEDLLMFQARCRYVLESTNRDLCSVNAIRIRRDSMYWLNQAIHFRELILQKYYRLCLTTAQRDYVNHFKHTVPLNDIINSYVLAATRAIDKCDFRQGVLTSHITNWFLTARENVGRSRGSSSVLLNEAVSFDEIEDTAGSGQEEGLLAHEQLRILSEVAKLVDPSGAARTYLRLQEYEP